MRSSAKSTTNTSTSSSIRSKVTNPNFKSTTTSNTSTNTANTNTQLTSFQRILATARKTGVLKLDNNTSTFNGEFPLSVCELHSNLLPDEKYYENIDLLTLSMINCSLLNINPAIQLLNSIEILNLSNNTITNLPIELYTLTKLKSLNLSNNRLTTINGELFTNYTELIELNLSQNSIQTIDHCTLSACSKLEILNISNNNLSIIPAELFQNTNKLLKLYLNHNRIIELSTVNLPTRLSILELQSNSLINLSANFQQLINLITINISNNCLTNFPAINKPNKLIELFAGNNQLDNTVLYTVANNHQLLSTIDLHNNRISELPTIELILLTNLKFLDLSNNNLSDLSAELGILKSLTKLLLDGNPLKKVPRSKLSNTVELKKYLSTRFTKEQLDYYSELLLTTNANNNINNNIDTSNLLLNNNSNTVSTSGNQSIQYAIRAGKATNELKLNSLANNNNNNNSNSNTTAVNSGGGLTELPTEIYNLSYELKLLDISNNSITTLSEQFIDRFSHSLKSFIANNNQLQSIPIGLFYCRNLLELSLANNQLIDIDHNTANLNQLQSLTNINLSRNLFQSFPIVLTQLKSLKSINLSNNSINNIPVELSLLSSTLTELDISNNRLTSISGSIIAKLTELSLLNLNNNDLNLIPVEIGYCTKLLTLSISGNPQKGISSIIINKGSIAIIEYLKKKLPIQSQSQPQQQQQQQNSNNNEYKLASINSKSIPIINSTAAVLPGRTTAALQSLAAESTAKIELLRHSINTISNQLESLSLSSSQQHALKKKLALDKSALIREERSASAASANSK